MSFRTWLPMSPAAKRGPHTKGLSPPNGRSMPAIRRLADGPQGCLSRGLRAPEKVGLRPVKWRQLSRLGRLVPASVRTRVADRMTFSDAASARAYRTALRDLDGEIVELRMRALKHPFAVRAVNDDLHATREVVTYRDVLPPDGVTPTSILNVGANIGAAIALLATRYPLASVVGVEGDEDNARLCERNIQPYGARVIHTAAWIHDGTVTFGGARGSSRLRASEGGIEVPAMSMNRLVEQTRPDFVTMDIEGGEQHLLAHGTDTDWAARVACISVEVNDAYTPEQCARDLERLGFRVSLISAPRAPRVVGRRDTTA